MIASARVKPDRGGGYPNVLVRFEPPTDEDGSRNG